MTKPIDKSRVVKPSKRKLWPTWIEFDWSKDRLYFNVIENNRVTLCGQALQGSLEEVAKMTAAGRCRISYALISPRQLRRVAKVGKLPLDFPG